MGDRLGRFIVNRLKVRVRLDEGRIGEILAGIDSASLGPAFPSTAGRLLGHLGDVMTLGFTPMAPAGGWVGGWEGRGREGKGREAKGGEETRLLIVDPLATACAGTVAPSSFASAGSLSWLQTHSHAAATSPFRFLPLCPCRPL